MPKERFFLESPLKEGELILLRDDEFHHLNVMRPKIKQQIEIVNGNGELGFATLETLEKKQASLFVEKVINEPLDKFKVILAQSFCRPNRLDFILEKSTELGVTDIWLFPGVYSEAKDLNDHKIARMRAITISAMKQCGRLYLPKITSKPALEHFEKSPYPAFFGDVDENAENFLDIWKKESQDEGVLFFIGTESGFSDAETKRLLSLGAKGVKINKNILRTDTAAITALSLIGSRLC